MRVTERERTRDKRWRTRYGQGFPERESQDDEVSKTHKREEKEKRKDTLIKLIQRGGDVMVIPSSKGGSLNIASVPTEE